ncbi:MAG: hypothetical protein GF398_13995 [Chitinivibrionales bacterium]|nr:hypothetical protein [Chitinivibrionales bacterium]
MNIVILDHAYKRKRQLCEVLELRRHNVIGCKGSGEFLNALDENSIDRILIDWSTWREGAAIYTYFSIENKLKMIPILFYNTPEGFYAISGRQSHEKDRVLAHPAKTDDIISTAEQFA